MEKENRREFCKYVSQSVLSMLGISCYILADTFYISNGVGADGLTALNLAIPVFSVVNGCGMMLGMGSAAKFAIMKETNGRRDVGILFTSTVFAAVVLGVLFVLLGLFAAEQMAVLVGADEQVYDMVRVYIRVILLFSPAFLMNNILNCYVRNDGNPSLSMKAMISGSVFNIIFDYIFIFPLHMGIFGAVLATGTAPVISMMILSLHFLQKKHHFQLVHTRPDIKAVCQGAALGIPSLVNEVSSGLVIAVYNMLILNIKGNIGVAAYGVVANLSIVVLAVYNGIGQGIQPPLSREFGRGNRKNIQQFFKYAVITVLVFAVLLYGILAGCAEPVTAVFNSARNMELQEAAVEGIRIYFTAVPFAGCNIIIAIYFVSTNKPFPAQVISLLRGLILMIPSACILADAAGIIGVWLAFPVTEAVVCIIATGLYFSVKKEDFRSGRWVI